LTGAQLTEVVDRFLRRDVVDQHVKAAEFGDGLLHGPLAVVFYGEVAADRHASLPGRSDQFRRAGRILVFGFGEVGDRDVGAFLCERDRHGASDTRVAAGDQGASSGKQAASFVVLHLIARRRVHLGGPARVFLLLFWRWLARRRRRHVCSSWSASL
jgi:hypothetical protein